MKLLLDSFRFRVICSAMLVAGAACFIPGTVTAQDAPETVLEGLNNPCGVTVQPETGDVFVADSGAGRIVRVVDGKAQEVVTGFPIDIYGKGPMYNIGPLGIAFLDKDTLVVGGGGKPDGEESLRVYKVPEKGGAAIKADNMLSSAMLPPTDDIKGEGNFYALAIKDGKVYVTCNGDDTKGWVSRATIEGGKIAKYERHIATKEATEVDAPVGVAIEPNDGHIAVGQMGEITVPDDSLLTFYSASDGSMLSNYETGLSDITALDYSPEKQLYALDFSWHDTKQGGLFQLVSKMENGQPVVETVKVASLDKPAAMKFSGDGSLYVTVIGSAAKDSDAPGGKLLRFKPAQLKK